MTHRTRTAAIGAALAAFAAGAADAETLRFAVGSPPNSLGDNAAQHFAEKAAEYSNGELEVEVYPLSLLNLMESNNGIRDGITDVGTILWPYFLTEYPETNYAAEMAALMELEEGDRDQVTLAYLGAVSEYVALRCEECREETKAQNQVFISGLGTSAYVLQCTRPVTTAEDLDGLAVRAGGAWWTRWLSAMGANPVQISVNETFEGLSQGVIACTASNPGDMTQFAFIDVISDVTVGVPGSVFAFAMGSMNRDAWLGLTEDERRAVLHAGAHMSGDGIMAYFDDGRENVQEKAPARGIEVHQASPELIAKSRAWIEQDLEAISASYEERFGAQDVDGKLETMRRLIQEWIPRMEGVDTREELAAVLWENVHSKIDVSTYGR